MRRRLTRREKRKRSKQLVMIISICLLLVIGVGYAAFSTTLTLKAKGNIKCSGTIAKDLLLKEVVINGDGLYKDEYEQGRYFYRGTNPNNYITFNNETWRIISLEETGEIKIIKNESVGKMEWADNTPWDLPIEINTYLNSTYLNSITTNFDKIISHDFKIGTISDFMNDDLINQINEENSKTWYGKIGLITGSEDIRLNSNIKTCETQKKLSGNGEVCKNTTWLKSDLFWTITTTNITTTNETNRFVPSVAGDGLGIAVLAGNENVKMDVRPVLYLSKDTKLCGNGTEENQYTIAN